MTVQPRLQQTLPQPANPKKKSKPTPIRTCVGCRTQKPDGELVRVTVGPGGVPVLGRGQPGRGAWICGEVSCIQAAGRSRAFSRALRSDLADPIFADTLLRWLCFQH